MLWNVQQSGTVNRTEQEVMGRFSEGERNIIASWYENGMILNTGLIMKPAREFIKVKMLESHGRPVKSESLGVGPMVSVFCVFGFWFFYSSLDDSTVHLKLICSAVDQWN